MQAVGIASGVAALVTEFSSAWTSGITAKSLLRIIGRMAGIYLSWFLVGWAVKEFGDCVGWW
jgi:hypothetical protein